MAADPPEAGFPDVTLKAPGDFTWGLNRNHRAISLDLTEAGLAKLLAAGWNRQVRCIISGEPGSLTITVREDRG